jgi:hypothetical protein
MRAGALERLMDTEKQAELVRLYIHSRRSSDTLNTRAEAVHEMAKRVRGSHPKDTTISVTPPSG